MAIGTDRVQVIKRESSATGGQDGQAGPLGEPVPINPQEDAVESAGVYLQDDVNRDEEVYIARVGDDVVFRDKNNPTPQTLTQVATGESGLSEESHKSLEQLVHLVSAGPVGGFDGGPYYFEVSPVSAVFPESMTWYQTSSKLKKIVSVDLTWSGVFASSATWYAYDSDGVTVVDEFTDGYSWSSGPFYPKITRTYGVT